MWHSRLPIFLAFIATIFFTLFEFILDGLIEKITIDVYLISRFIYSYLIIVTVLFLVQHRLKSSAIVFISLRSIDAILWSRAIITVIYILALSIAFKETSSQAIAYSFFVLHPIAQIGASRLLWGKWPPIKNQIVPVIAMIMGVIIFVIANSSGGDERTHSLLKDVIAYFFAFLAGCGFAYTNEQSTFIKEKSKREALRVTGTAAASGISSLQLTTYTTTAIFYSMPLTATIVIVALSSVGQQTIWDGLSYTTFVNWNLAALFGACILVMLGTWLVTEAFTRSEGKNTSQIAAMDLLIVPFALGLDFCFGKVPKENPNLPWVLLGLAIIVIGAMRSAFVYADND